MAELGPLMIGLPPRRTAHSLSRGFVVERYRSRMTSQAVSSVPRKRSLPLYRFFKPIRFSDSFPGGVRPVHDPCRPVYAARSGWSNGSIEQQTGKDMSAQKITDEQWVEARKRYETEPGLGFGKIAQVLDCSKSLVARKAREGKWQKDIGVPNQVHLTARERQAKVTESAVPSPTLSPHVYAPDAGVSPSRVVSGVFMSQTAAQGMTTDVNPGGGTIQTASQSTAYADEMQVPDGLGEWEREEFVKAAIVARQRSINARHLKELNAARSKLYESLKKAGTKEGPGAALSAQRNVAALLALHQGEMDAELQRVRLEVAEFVGKPLKPTPCRIIVHVREGVSLLKAAAPYGPNAIAVTDVEHRKVPHA